MNFLGNKSGKFQSTAKDQVIDIKILIIKIRKQVIETKYNTFSKKLFLLSKRFLKKNKYCCLENNFSRLIQVNIIKIIINNCIIDKQDAIEKLANSGCWKSCKIRIDIVEGVVGASINDISITVAENINTTNIVIFNFL